MFTELSSVTLSAHHVLVGNDGIQTRFQFALIVLVTSLAELSPETTSAHCVLHGEDEIKTRSS